MVSCDGRRTNANEDNYDEVYENAPLKDKTPAFISFTLDYDVYTHKYNIKMYIIQRVTV